jgi:hypothetical protein
MDDDFAELYGSAAAEEAKKQGKPSRDAFARTRG